MMHSFYHPPHDHQHPIFGTLITEGKEGKEFVESQDISVIYCKHPSSTTHMFLSSSVRPFTPAGGGARSDGK